MVNFRDLVTAFRKLEIDRSQPVLVHSSLSSLGEVHGGAETVIGALLAAYQSILMPTFTYKTMLIPESGPEDNAIDYGSGKDANRMAEFFDPDMPADRLMGIIPEAFRKHPRASRTGHPILSFAGIGVDAALDSQTLEEPLAPIHVLRHEQGWVILAGVDHSVNTSIHYAERLAGRRQFIRWALTSEGVKECPGFPGCSNGFQMLAPRLDSFARRVSIGKAVVQAVPLAGLVDTVVNWFREDPLALLCQLADCERCNAVRADVARQQGNQDQGTPG